MQKDELVSRLQLFIEKAERLASSNFVKRALDDSGVKMRWAVDEPLSATRRGPDQENIDAFVLTFRFFIQDNESISLRNTTEIFHSTFALPNEKTEFDHVRKCINDFLDGNSMFNLGGIISRRELMLDFIYGGLSHANLDRKKRHDDWMRDPILSHLVQNEFVVVLIEVVNGINYIKQMCQGVLSRLSP